MTGTSQTGRLLKHLKHHKSITNRQIVDHLNILRYSARIAELRQEGHIIEAVRVRDGLFRYYYRGHRDEPEPVKTQGIWERTSDTHILKWARARLR